MLEAKNEAKLEFPGGMGQNKKPSVEGVWIFSGTARTGKIQLNLR